MDALIRRLKKRFAPKARSTVRYAFPAVAVFSALVGVALTISSNHSYVRVATTPQEVRAGESFTIDIYASAHVPTNAVDIKVEYPDEQIEIKNIETGESIITIWTVDPYAKDGVIHLSGGVFRRGFLGEHLIARVNATAVEAGVARILASQTTFLAGDGKGTSVSVERTGSERASVTVDDATAQDVKPGSIESKVAIGIITDIDGDGEVGAEDLERFIKAWRGNSTLFDFNGDGRMTFRDFGILLAHAFLK